MPNVVTRKRLLRADRARLYNILISQLGDFAVFLTDPHGFLASWNPGVERILGYAEDEWVGNSVEMIFTPEDRAAGKPQQEMDNAIQGGQAPDVRWHLRRDGSRVYVEGTLVALSGQDGRLFGFSKVMRDVTARKLREVQLQDALTYAESIVETVTDPLLVLDAESCIRSANRAFYRTFRVSKEETEGQPLYQLGNGQWSIPQLRTLLEELVPNQTTIENFEVEHDFPGLGRKIMLLNARKLWREGNHTELTLLVMQDITERKRAEDALRQSEERWRSLFERMAEGFFVGQIIHDEAGRAADFRFKEVNPAFERLTGLIGAAGRTLHEVLAGADGEFLETFARVVRTGEPAHFEIQVSALQNRWFEVRARRTEPDCFAVLFLDVSERKSAELQAKLNERRQAALVTLGDRLRDVKDISSITAVAMEIVGTTLDVGRAGYGRVDVTQEYLTIENDWTSKGVTTLAGSYRFEDFGIGLGKSLRRGELLVIPDIAMHPITAGESERWKALDIRAVINVPLVENGALAALLFIQDPSPRVWTEADLTFVRKVADRTWAAAERARALQELQQSEEFARSVLASSPDCVKVVDLDGRLLSINDGGRRQLEIDDVAPYLFQHWAGLWGEKRDTAEQALATAMQGHTARFEGFCPTAKGTSKWWEVVVTPVRDTSGKPVRILSISRDITERQRAEEERDRLTRELKRSNEELSKFAHIVAHDLQTPLRGIVSFAQLLRRKALETLDTDNREFLHHIIESAHRMNELVQALLRFAQLGQGEIQRRPVEMDLALDAALQSLQLDIEERQARITRVPLPVVTGDSVQLVQVLQNLISNALKYRRPGEVPHIEIGVSSERREHVFTVTDNGEGIEPEYLNSIFEPLKRLHGADVPGTGLGLAMCQQIVKRHEGRIWVESQHGVGSTFRFTLPKP